MKAIKEDAIIRVNKKLFESIESIQLIQSTINDIAITLIDVDLNQSTKLVYREEIKRLNKVAIEKHAEIKRIKKEMYRVGLLK